MESTLALSLALGAMNAPLAAMAQLKAKSAAAKAAPSPAWQWAAKDCQRIPCRIIDAEPGINDALQGPPKIIKDGPSGKMLLYPSGRVAFCFDDSCSKTSGAPMTPSEAQKYLIEEYAEKKPLADK